MPTITTIVRGAAVVAALATAACGSDDEPTATDAPTSIPADAQDDVESDDATVTTTPPPTTAAPIAPPPTVATDSNAPSLWELLEGVDDLGQFREAVVVGGLQERFEDCSTTVTVFAPNAFALEMIEGTFGPGVLSAHIDAGEVDEVRRFVLDHMVDGAYDNESFSTAGAADIDLETLLGRPLAIINRDPGAARRVLLVDQFATQPLLGCNGALHETSWVIAGY